MRKMKKIASLMMALVMVLAMSVTAFAADITVQNATEGETYTAYQIFSATEADGNITYYIGTDSAYYSDVDESELFTLVGPNSEGLYQVTWSESNNDTIIAFLTGLGAKGNAVGTAVATSSGATITVSEAGYYFVTTSVGSVISIGSTDGTGTISEKNTVPTPTKTVSDTESGSGSETNTAAIGDSVYYTVVIANAGKISNLVVTDTLSAGLTLTANSVVVTVNGSTVEATVVEGDDTVTNYTVDYGTYNSTTGTTLTITFEDDYLDTLASDASITITYSAVVNENAVSGTTSGNTNEVELSYGNSQTSTSDSTTTYVYDFDLKKVKDDETTVLNGAEFTLSESGTAIFFVAVEGGYRVATAAEITAYQNNEEGAAEVVTTITAGDINISGLDAGTYTLTETKAPAGYNQLDSAITVTIGEDGSVSLGNDSNTSGSASGTTVTVVNNAGTALPSTGGIGTTIFYIVGTVLVLGAAVVLITRRRMSSEA